jgi:ferredoxin
VQAVQTTQPVPSVRTWQAVDGGAMIRIEIDRDRCVGSGNCLFWAPNTFDLDDGGTAVVIDPDGDGEELARVAADGCPTRAITVIDHLRASVSNEHDSQGGPGADRTVR